MANELLTRALEECRARRFENERVQQSRMAHATQLCPEIALLDEQRREGILSGLRLAIEGIRPEGVEEQTIAINEKIASLLIRHGLDKDYLEPVYQCADCQDTGYLGQAPKALCECVTRRYHELLSGEQDTPDSPSFENFDLNVFPKFVLDQQGTTQQMLMGVLKRHCERFAQEVPEGKLTLLLYGPSGLGKTYLLRAIAQRARARGIQALTFNANDLLNHIREAYFARDEQVDQPYYDVPLLLIDDLGTEPLWENITLEQIFALLEHRIQHSLPTVISTNLSLDNLTARYTRRIASRLLDKRNSLVLQFMGQDIRLHQADR